jgi:hypothetical protein
MRMKGAENVTHRAEKGINRAENENEEGRE